jgi:hypothetical protein
MKPETDSWFNPILKILAFPVNLAGTVIEGIFSKKEDAKKNPLPAEGKKDADLEKLESRKRDLQEKVADLASKEQQSRFILEELESQMKERQIKAVSEIQAETGPQKKDKEEELEGRLKKSEEDHALQMNEKIKLETEKIERNAREKMLALEQEVEDEKKRRLASLEEEIKPLEEKKRTLLEEISDLASKVQQGRAAIARLEDQITKNRLEAESRIKEEIASMKSVKEEEFKEQLKKLEEELELQISEKRKLEMEKVEREIRAAKEKALAGVMEWTKREENRLKERLEREYEAQLSSLRGALEKKIQDEFGHIHELFASLANQKKAVAEKDIKEFLDKKLTDIVSTIKT